MIPSPDDHVDDDADEPVDVSEQMAELLAAHRTEELAAEDGRVVASFYMTLVDAGVSIDNNDVVYLTSQWMNLTWSGGDA
jgi:hypothetical protein